MLAHGDFNHLPRCKSLEVLGIGWGTEIPRARVGEESRNCAQPVDYHLDLSGWLKNLPRLRVFSFREVRTRCTLAEPMLQAMATHRSLREVSLSGVKMCMETVSRWLGPAGLLQHRPGVEYHVALHDNLHLASPAVQAYAEALLE